MRTITLAACIFFAGSVHAQEPDFRWTLPTPADAAKITAEAFPGTDAVIIAKEQGFTEGQHTKSIFVIYNDVTVTSLAVMVKLFNAKAVETFGSFSYEFPDLREKVERHIFKIRVRVMKPDGTVHVLPDSAIQRVTGISTGRGRALTQKVMYKLPDLAPGDIVQYEYSHAEPFSNKRQVLFYYHDRYPVLTSMAYVNMTKQEHVEYVHFPPEKFGPPDVKDYGKTTFSAWTLKRLAAVPDEPYGRPLSDVTYMTTVVNKADEADGDGWRPIAKRYYKEYIAKGSVSSSFLEELGLNPSLENPEWPQIDSLYTALRKYFRLKETVSKYTGRELMDKQIEEKEADATDVMFFMLKALKQWGIEATPILMRDRREGVYEMTVPSLVWFNRLALLVSYKGKDVIFDADRCIPSKYETPWFLNPTMMFAVEDTGGVHLQLKLNSSWREHISSEMHQITLKPGKKAADSVVFALKGARAQTLRGELYTEDGDELDGSVRSYLEEHALEETKSSGINAFLDEPTIIISGSGDSHGTSTTIDSFLLYQPRNHLVRSFRDEFSLPTRHYDIFLPQPFACSLMWQVAIPAGYRISRVPEEIQIVGPAGTTAQISYMQLEDALTVKAIVVFSTATIPLDTYAEWRTYLDKVNGSMEREIAFVKLKKK